MSDDDVRRRILARRSVMIAAALATSTTACPKSEPCLSVDPRYDAAADPRPLVCLSQVYVPPDAGSAPADASATDAAPREGGIVLAPLDIVHDSGAPVPVPCLSTPRPCLTVTAPPPPPPRPCLTETDPFK